MIIKLRTRERLEDLLEKGKSESWVVAEGRENQIKKVEIYQFDCKRALLAEFNKSKSIRTESGRLIVAFTKGKLVDCNYKWTGQNPVKYADIPFYQEVKIGNQIWMDVNLNVDNFRNGDSIPQAKSAEEWKIANDMKQPAWCYYDNNSLNGLQYGKIYNWFAVNDPRGLAPVGWHIASDDEWTQMEQILSTDNKKLKQFMNPGGGYGDQSFKFYNLGRATGYWTSTEGDPSWAWNRDVGIDLSFGRSRIFKEVGIYVRCVKDIK